VDNGRLQRQNKDLSSKVDGMTRQCRELTNRVAQQGQVQEKMRQRLYQMDAEAQRSSQQVWTTHTHSTTLGHFNFSLSL